MKEVSVSERNGRVYLEAPYSPELPRMAKDAGGRWDAALRCWTFDPRDRARAEAIAAEVYGWSPASEGGATVDVRVSAQAYSERWAQELRVAGRRVAWRPGRDAAARLSDGVVAVEGTFGGRGGSVRRPELWGEGASDDVVLELRDLPESALSLLDRGYEVVRRGEGPDRAALAAERERLLARVAEIDALLA